MKSKKMFGSCFDHAQQPRPNMTLRLAALMLGAALTFVFVSCKTETEDDTVYRTVTYSTEHAAAPKKLTVADGTALTEEQLPALTESRRP